MSYIRTTKEHLKLGGRVEHSVFNQKGELLLREGNVITTRHQLDTLLNQGHILKAELFVPGQTEKQQLPRYQSLSKTSIFETKNKWLSELYLLLIRSQDSGATNFSHRVLTLALDLQLQAEKQHNGLIAALQLDFENHYGLVHALHCAVNCEMLGKSMRMGQVDRLAIVAAALTHNIGIIINQEKLNRQKDELTHEQRRIIENHPQKGEQILTKFGVDDQRWLDAVKHQHERLDGSGYYKLKAGQISIEALVLAVADTYAAMVHPTIYREENSGKRALNTLIEGSHKLFDAKIVQSFIAEIGVYPPGSLVRLGNNEIAVVVAQGKHSNKPVVYALTTYQGVTYSKPVLRETELEQYKILNDEPLRKHNILLEKIENIWID